MVDLEHQEASAKFLDGALPILSAPISVNINSEKLTNTVLWVSECFRIIESHLIGHQRELANITKRLELSESSQEQWTKAAELVEAFGSRLDQMDPSRHGAPQQMPQISLQQATISCDAVTRQPQQPSSQQSAQDQTEESQSPVQPQADRPAAQKAQAQSDANHFQGLMQSPRPHKMQSPEEELFSQAASETPQSQEEELPSQAPLEAPQEQFRPEQPSSPSQEPTQKPSSPKQQPSLENPHKQQPSLQEPQMESAQQPLPLQSQYEPELLELRQGQELSPSHKSTDVVAMCVDGPVGGRLGERSIEVMSDEVQTEGAPIELEKLESRDTAQEKIKEEVAELNTALRHVEDIVRNDVKSLADLVDSLQLGLSVSSGRIDDLFDSLRNSHNNPQNSLSNSAMEARSPQNSRSNSAVEMNSLPNILSTSAANVEMKRSPNTPSTSAVDVQDAGRTPSSPSSLLTPTAIRNVPPESPSSEEKQPPPQPKHDSIGSSAKPDSREKLHSTGILAKPDSREKLSSRQKASSRENRECEEKLEAPQASPSSTCARCLANPDSRENHGRSGQSSSVGMSLEKPSSPSPPVGYGSKPSSPATLFVSKPGLEISLAEMRDSVQCELEQLRCSILETVRAKLECGRSQALARAYAEQGAHRTVEVESRISSKTSESFAMFVRHPLPNCAGCASCGAPLRPEMATWPRENPRSAVRSFPSRGAQKGVTVSMKLKTQESVCLKVGTAPLLPPSPSLSTYDLSQIIKLPALTDHVREVARRKEKELLTKSVKQNLPKQRSLPALHTNSPNLQGTLGIVNLGAHFDRNKLPPRRARAL